MSSVEPTRLHVEPAADAPVRRRRPGASRARRVEELNKGNRNAWRHGIAATVAALPDMQTEVALIFASHPALDPIRDTRLVEHLAMITVRARRLHLELDAQGPTPVLTSYSARLDPLLERLERSVHEREQLRIRQVADQSRTSGLERYRSGSRSVGEES